MFRLRTLLSSRLQRDEKSRRCALRNRAAGKEHGARDLLERRQRRVVLERLREYARSGVEERGCGTDWRPGVESDGWLAGARGAGTRLSSAIRTLAVTAFRS
jgi:hypothetical protein